MAAVDVRRGYSRWFLMLVAGLPLFYFSYLKRGLQLDDALIYMRYVRNFFDGYGLVYNIGERHNALTSPLFTYLSLLLGFFLNNHQLATILLSTACFWVFAVVMARVFFRDEVIKQTLLVVFVSVTPPFLYLTYGMESTLLMMLCALLLWAYQGGRLFWVGALAGLLAITRTEAVLLPLCVLVDYVLKNKRFPDAGYFIAPVLVVGASYGFNYFYYGHLLPDSALAKLGQGKSGLWGSGWRFLKYSGYLKSWAFHDNYSFLFGFLVSVLLGLWQSRTTRMHRIVVPYLLAYVAVCTVAGVPNYHWYYTPLFAFASVFAAVGVIGLARREGGRIHAWIRVPAAVLLGGYLVLCGFTYSNQPSGSHEPYRKIGLWLKQNTEPSAKIAMVEIGTVGWYSERHIIDILGLVTPLNASFIAERKFSAWLDHYSPDYILLHEPLMSQEQSANDPRIARGYRPDDRFTYDGYRLLKKLGG